MIKNFFRHNIHRFFCLCPTFLIQDTYRKVKHLFNTEDIYTDPSTECLKKIIDEIKLFAKKARERNLPIPATLLLMDDLAGGHVLHTNRKGVFANFSIQSRHWNTTIIVISQQPSSIDPNYRDNAENVLVFPSEREDDCSWIIRSYGSKLIGRSISIPKILDIAWHGGTDNPEEWGKHFLFIQAKPRQKTSFYIDFNKKINCYLVIYFTF